MKAEFDLYIKGYRDEIDKNLIRFSGESSNFFADYKALKLKEWLPEYGNKSPLIADFGCGDGLMASYIANYFPQAKIHGIDPSPESIKVAQQKYPHFHFTINSDQKSDLDFDDNYFDIIYSAGTFHHIPFKYHEGYIQEIHRILKPNGIFILYELNPLNPLTSLIFRLSPIEVNAKMLNPWYAYRLLKNYGKLTRKFNFFFPKFLSFLRPIEKYMTKIPCGGLYAIMVRKSK